MVRDPTCGRSAAFRLSRPAAWSASSRSPRLSKAYAMVRSPPINVSIYNLSLLKIQSEPDFESSSENRHRIDVLR
jgi:hypothetical protein